MKPLSIIALAGVALAGAWHLQAQAGAATIEPRDPVLAIFREAKAAARGAPSPAAERILVDVARQEMEAGETREATDDLTALFARVHAWGTLSPDDPVQNLGAVERGVVEGVIIRTLAQAGDFDQALNNASKFDPAPKAQASYVYNWIIEAMVEHRQTGRALEAIDACVRADGSFPFDGAIALVKDGDGDHSYRDEIALDALRAADAATETIDVNTATNFLRHLHAIRPGLDARVESIALGLLSKVGTSAPSDGGPQARLANAALLIAVIGEIDPDRAREERIEFPGQLPGSSPLHVEATKDGRMTLGLGASVEAKVADQSLSNPAGALAGAEGLQDAGARFRSLAAVANALAISDPEMADRAANDAASLLRERDDLWLTSLASAMKLAATFERLGDHRAAEDLTERGLDHADAVASTVQREVKDLSPPEQAQRFWGMALTTITLAAAFRPAAAVNPALALRHAREVESPLLKPGVLAVVASELAKRQGAK